LGEDIRAAAFLANFGRKNLQEKVFYPPESACFPAVYSNFLKTNIQLQI
jgi:hypothetical protein